MNELLMCKTCKFGDLIQLAKVVCKYGLGYSFTMKTHTWMVRRSSILVNIR
jgi:hypothetical protein